MEKHLPRTSAGSEIDLNDRQEIDEQDADAAGGVGDVFYDVMPSRYHVVKSRTRKGE